MCSTPWKPTSSAAAILLVTLRPNSSPGEPDPEAALIKMLGGWGVQVGDDVIVDQVVRLFAGPALGLNPVVNTYGAHPITNGFSQRTVFPMTRSVEPESQLKAGLTVVGLAKTSDTSWARDRSGGNLPKADRQV